MKVYKKETKTITKEVNTFVSRNCDLCGKPSADDSDWKNGGYEVSETEVEMTVKLREGLRFPEGSYVEGYDIDLCPECFNNELVPWLISKGAKIERKDFGY